MEEEVQKRNTDCVYFLASPLTCKKGNGCEFRHSEAARMNPRDCWYWIHSTCRNPNCSFRHPPLEGKQISAPPQTSGTAVATIPLASSISMPATALSSKSKVPCYFFSQNHCAKGDKCPFLHGPSLPSSIEVASQQKPSKASPAEAVQASNKPVVILKGHSSNAGKQTPQENSEKLLVGCNDSSLASTKVPISVQDMLHVVKESERIRVPDTSATTDPYRIEKAPGSRKSRATLFSDTQEEFPNLNPLDGHRDVQALTDKSRQGHPGRKQLHQHENERPHPRQALDLRYQNGSKSDVVWKNESPSLDGDGSDQSIQREDGEYSPHQRSRRRARVYDDSTDYSFQAPKSYGQGSDTAPFQHRQPQYLQRRDEQQVHQGSDDNGSIEHTRHHGYPSSVRTSARDGQRVLSSSSNVDLRDHLLKRRWDDRDRHARSESLLRRDILDIPHMNHRRDENLTQQGQQSRATYRRADSRGGKWPCHDGGVSPDSCSRGSPIKRFGSGRSPVRASSMGSPSRHPMVDYLRSEERERGRDRNISKSALTSDARTQLKSKSVRAEKSREESGFAGPKSLAQIKAEKMADAELDSKVVHMQGRKGKYLEGSGKLADVGLPVVTNNQNSTASTSRLKRSRADITSTSKRGSSFNYNNFNSEDFEGPKPLSLLLEKKKKMEPGESEGGVAVSKKTEDLMADSHREVEDGEVRDEDDPHSHQTDSPNALLQEGIASRSRVASDSNNEEALEEEADEGHDDVGSSEEEMRLGVEIGEAMSGDEDYGLDDDEEDDDFAKKLGGFFT